MGGDALSLRLGNRASRPRRCRTLVESGAGDLGKRGEWLRHGVRSTGYPIAQVDAASGKCSLGGQIPAGGGDRERTRKACG